MPQVAAIYSSERNRANATSKIKTPRNLDELQAMADLWKLEEEIDIIDPKGGE